MHFILLKYRTLSKGLVALVTNCGQEDAHLTQKKRDTKCFQYILCIIEKWRNFKNKLDQAFIFVLLRDMSWFEEKIPYAKSYISSS